MITIGAAFIGGAFVMRSTNKQIAVVTRQYSNTIRPFVIARLTTRAGVALVLEIENIGKSPAAELSLSLDRDFYQFGSRDNLRTASAFRRVIPHFAPSERLTFDLSQGFNFDNFRDGEEKTPRSFTVEARYKFDGQLIKESFFIDIGPTWAPMLRSRLKIILRT